MPHTPLSGTRSAVGGIAALGSTAGGVLSAVSGVPHQMAGVLRHRFPTVAVTGMSGVGKSRLIDRLTRHTSLADDEAGSAVMEKRTRRGRRGKGFRFRVVPGDNAATRLRALDDVFYDDPVDGVIHVVAYGYATPRPRIGTIAPQTREELLQAELEDWTITAHRIAAMAVRRDRPVWLMIVVTKTDLFAGDLDAALAYYSVGSGTPFGDKLDELRALAGGARISVDVVATSVPTANDAAATKRADAQLTALDRRMGQLSGHH